MRPIHCAMLCLAASCILSMGIARADDLVTLRSTLRNLNSNTPITGTLNVQSVKMDPKQEDGKNQVTTQKPPVRIELKIDAGNGLSIHLAPDLLQQISAEQQANADDPEKPTPLGNLLGQVGPMDVESIVSAAPDLLHTLDGAVSPVLKSGQFNGKPARELIVTLPLKASKKEKSNIDDYQGSMTLWLDAKDVPLAYKQIIHAKFCKFFMCVSVDETRSAEFQVMSGRLIAISYTDEHKQAGMGQDSHTETIYTFVLSNEVGNKTSIPTSE